MLSIESLHNPIFFFSRTNLPRNPRCRFHHSNLLHLIPNRFTSTSTPITLSFRDYNANDNLQFKIRVSTGSHRLCHTRHGGASKIRASGGGGQNTDSGGEETNVTEGAQSSPNSSTSKSPNPKQGKGGWWWWLKGGKWKWEWQPIIQAHEVGLLLLQLGIGLFVMRLLRPGIPLPGAESVAAQTTFISVPYSDFLSKVNSNLVHKVEVDGVNIMFKLRSGNGEVGSEGNGVGSKLQGSEMVIRSVAPTKRIIYTTTRPVDIKTPYEKMLENNVEFGSPDKRSGGFLNSALIALFYIAVLVGFFQRFPVNFSQQMPGQLRNKNRKGRGSSGGKAADEGDTVTFADVAGVDEAKEELEEIVVFLS